MTMHDFCFRELRKVRPIVKLRVCSLWRPYRVFLFVQFTRLGERTGAKSKDGTRMNLLLAEESPTEISYNFLLFSSPKVLGSGGKRGRY